MPLKQYSREFILSKRCQTVNDISVLASIDATLDLLTKKGIKAVNAALTKKNTKALTPKCKPLEKSNFGMLKNAVNFYMNTEDTSVRGGCSIMDNSANQNVVALNDSITSFENQNLLPRSSPDKRIQYSREFLLTRKCVPNSGEVFAHVTISKFKFSPFTQAGIKKILWAKNQYKKKSDPLKLNLNSNLPEFGSQRLDPNSQNFQPLSQIENYNYSFPDVPNFHLNMETACLPSSMSMERQKFSANELEKKCESRLHAMKDKYEEEIRVLKAQHFKEVQNMKLKVKEDFEKTLGVANSVILIDDQEVKSTQLTLKEQLEASLAQNKEYEQLNTILRKQFEDKENELKLHILLTNEEKEQIRKECKDLMDVVIEQDKDKAKQEFLQIFETELECPICSEMFIEASLLSSCSHAFCLHCINNWTRTRAPHLNCPLCRAPFVQANIKPFPLGQSIMLKIEDKLPGETLVRRRGVIAQRNANPNV